MTHITNLPSLRFEFPFIIGVQRPQKTGRYQKSQTSMKIKTIKMKKGMCKVSVIYPNGEGKTFDMNYYLNTHLPLVAELLGDSLKGATVEKGLGGAIPGSAAPFAGMGNMYFDSAADFGKAFGPNAEKIMGDLPNFTNIEPIVQVSEVMA
jgi:uncharacterized protein (TIGR02118 family)